MKLFIDSKNRKLVQSVASSREISPPSFTRGDSEVLEIHIVDQVADGTNSDRVFTPLADSLRVAIARFGQSPKVLSLASEYEAITGGGARIELPLNTAQLATALGESKSLSAYLEVEYSNSDGEICTVLQTACTVRNDLIENDATVEATTLLQTYVAAAQQAAQSAQAAATLMVGADYVKIKIRGSNPPAYMYLVFETDGNGNATPTYYTEAEYNALT